MPRDKKGEFLRDFFGRKHYFKAEFPTLKKRDIDVKIWEGKGYAIMAQMGHRFEDVSKSAKNPFGFKAIPFHRIFVRKKKPYEL